MKPVMKQAHLTPTHAILLSLMPPTVKARNKLHSHLHGDDLADAVFGSSQR